MISHPQPQDAIVAEMLTMLDAGQRETFEERSAIRQFDGQFPLGHAESLAMLEVLRRYPATLTGITVLQIEIDGGNEWLLTTDVPLARQYLADIGAKEVEPVNLAKVINEQYDCLACLTTLG